MQHSMERGMPAKILISLTLQDFFETDQFLKLQLLKKFDNFLVLLLAFKHNSSPNNNTLNELYLSSLNIKTIIYYTST